VEISLGDIGMFIPSAKPHEGTYVNAELVHPHLQENAPAIERPFEQPPCCAACSEDCGGCCNSNSCYCCGNVRPCDRSCCAVTLTSGYRESAWGLIVLSIVQIAIGSAVYNFAHPTPGAGAFWCGMISIFCGILGVYGSCNAPGVAFTFFAATNSVILNIVGLCIDGPRLTEFASYTECCNKAGVCYDTPQASSVSNTERMLREGVISKCLNKRRDFFYPPSNSSSTDPLPNIACAGKPFEASNSPDPYACKYLSPGYDSQNIFFFQANNGWDADPRGVWQWWAPHLRACVAVDVLCFVSCIVMFFHSMIVLSRICCCRQRSNRPTRQDVIPIAAGSGPTAYPSNNTYYAAYSQGPVGHAPPAYPPGYNYHVSPAYSQGPSAPSVVQHQPSYYASGQIYVPTGPNGIPSAVPIKEY